GPRGGRRRLHHQAVLPPGADRPGQGGAAPQAAADAGGGDQRPRPGVRPGQPPRHHRRPAGGDGADGIPPPGVLPRPPGSGLLPGPDPRPRLGRQRLHGRAHRRRPYPPPAQGPVDRRPRAADPDGAGRRLPLVHPIGTGLTVSPPAPVSTLPRGKARIRPPPPTEASEPCRKDCAPRSTESSSWRRFSSPLDCSTATPSPPSWQGAPPTWPSPSAASTASTPGSPPTTIPCRQRPAASGATSPTTSTA